MKRRRRPFAVVTGLAVLLLAALTAWIGLEYRQDQLDHRLIQALRKQDTPLALRLLDEGASANALELAPEKNDWRHSLGDLKNRMLHRTMPEKQRDYAPAITLVYPDTMAIFMPGERPAENPPLVRALVEHGADVNAWDSRGFTLLHKAAMAKHVETVRYLLEHNANPNAQNDEGKVPLVWSNAEISTLLLNHGADVDRRDTSGDTPLVMAVCKDDRNLLAGLLAAHANINTVDDRGMSPLHFAVLSAYWANSTQNHKYEWMARLLMVHGARVDIKDHKGNTALDDARRYKLTDLIPLLEQAARREKAGR